MLLSVEAADIAVGWLWSRRVKVAQDKSQIWGMMLSMLRAAMFRGMLAARRMLFESYGWGGVVVVVCTVCVVVVGRNESRCRKLTLVFLWVPLLPCLLGSLVGKKRSSWLKVREETRGGGDGEFECDVE